MKKLKPPAPRRLGLVPIGDILADLGWNTRAEVDEQADAALRESIAREGLLQPLGVAPRDGKPPWSLVYGFRRHRAAMELGLPEVPVVEVPADRARAANLAENALRSDLSPWELLEALARARDEKPKQPMDELAAEVGLSPAHVANLLRLRRKLCPELLEAYRERGRTMHLRYLLRVCTMPHADQAAAYSALVTGSRGGRPLGAESGSRPPRGLAEPKHLRKWLRELDAGPPSQFTRGAKMALECALGRRAWLLGPAAGEETSEDEPGEGT